MMSRHELQSMRRVVIWISAVLVTDGQIRRLRNLPQIAVHLQLRPVVRLLGWPPRGFLAYF
jgi:hypothetical protein